VNFSVDEPEFTDILGFCQALFFSDELLDEIRFGGLAEKP
jgi:hypothetical protein